jgi:antirestriction protein ArdC
MCKVYDVINSRIMELLEQGTVPWKRTWGSTGGSQPTNLISRKEYRGINCFMLGCQEYSSPYWLTFKQAQDKGGHVKKGSRSCPVIFWKWLDKKDAGSDDADTVIENGKIPMLRYYSVFNLEQVEGIEAPPATETIINTFTPIERAEQIIINMPLRPDIHHGGTQPAYHPALDYVKIPIREAFESSEEYYCTLFHELGHSTGHAKRLGRKGILEPSYFGSHVYGQEEMCVEFCSSYLSGVAGIENAIIENSASYISSWMKAIKANPKMCVLAAAQAQKASDYILCRKGGEDDIVLNDIVA